MSDHIPSDAAIHHLKEIGELQKKLERAEMLRDGAVKQAEYFLKQRERFSDLAVENLVAYRAVCHLNDFLQKENARFRKALEWYVSHSDCLDGHEADVAKEALTFPQREQ